jgi:hypothetical protein
MADDEIGFDIDDDWEDDTPPGPDVYEEVSKRYGPSCPACGAVLGAVPPHGTDGLYLSTPSICLEVCSPTNGQRAWRITVVGRPQATLRSYEPMFTAKRVEHLYILCGNGHIFPLGSTLRRTPTYFQVHDWNTIAAVGPVASGKTYMLTRMLSQNLIHFGRYPTGRRTRPIDIRSFAGLPLEDYALATRRDHYQATLTSGEPIAPTGVGSLWDPANILNSQVSIRMIDAVIELLRATVDESILDEDQWGTMPPQPIMLRTRLGDGPHSRLGWTCIVDLAGEFFNALGRPDAQGTVAERAKLRGYNALVWAIDPLLEDKAFDRFVEQAALSPEYYERLLRGSMRPGTTEVAGKTIRSVRIDRQFRQRAIAADIVRLDNTFVADESDTMRLLIAVSKVDIIRLVLEKARLDDLGVDGQFKAGIVHYLAHVAENLDGRYRADAESAALLRQVDHRQVPDEDTLQETLSDLADALIAFYSDPDRFWALVETGEAATIPLDPDEEEYDGYVGRALTVPGIGEHLHRALLPGRPDAAGRVRTDEVFLTRDLVMSAIACGMVFALGYGNVVVNLMSMPWIDLRLFLCSSLADAPETAEHGSTMETRDGQPDFAATDDRSAALTQLFLHVLRGVL